MPLELTSGQSVTVTAAGSNAAGNIVLDPSQITWQSSDPGFLTVFPNADGSALLTAVGPTGTVTLTLSYGGITYQDSVTITSSAPTSLIINFGIPA